MGWVKRKAQDSRGVPRRWGRVLMHHHQRLGQGSHLRHPHCGEWVTTDLVLPWPHALTIFIRTIGFYLKLLQHLYGTESYHMFLAVADDKENDVTVQLDYRPDLSRRTTPSRTTPSRYSRSPSFQRKCNILPLGISFLVGWCPLWCKYIIAHSVCWSISLGFLVCLFRGISCLLKEL